MTMYGLYVKDLAAGDLVWFTVDKSPVPGRYVRGRREALSPDVYVAESIPALILEVAPLIQEAEQNAVSSLWTSDLPRTAERHLRDDMTERLLQHLTETSAIWIANPAWVNELRPFIQQRSPIMAPLENRCIDTGLDNPPCVLVVFPGSTAICVMIFDRLGLGSVTRI
jgi:hypothetical protein